MKERKHIKVKAFLYKHLPEFVPGDKHVSEEGNLSSLYKDQDELKKKQESLFENKGPSQTRKLFEDAYGPAIKLSKIAKDPDDITKQKGWTEFDLSGKPSGYQYMSVFVRSITPASDNKNKVGPLVLPGVEVEGLAVYKNKSGTMIGASRSSSTTDSTGFATITLRKQVEEVFAGISDDVQASVVYCIKIEQAPFFPYSTAAWDSSFKGRWNMDIGTWSHLYNNKVFSSEEDGYNWIIIPGISPKLVQAHEVGTDKMHIGLYPRKTALRHRWEKTLSEILGKDNTPRGYTWEDGYVVYRTLDAERGAIGQQLEEANEKILKRAKGNFKIDRFSIDLKEEDFLKVDISRFVSNYSVTSTLDEGIPTWSLILKNGFVTKDDLKCPRKVNQGKGVGFTELSDSTLLNRIAQYETYEAYNFDTCSYFDRSAIEERKEAIKGKRKEFSEDVSDKFLLSDLIQGMNYISCYVYADELPPEEIKRISNVVVKQDGDLLEKTRTRLYDDFEMDLKYYGYTNEFNGFVIDKSFSSKPNAVDTVTVEGIGWTGLMSMTRTLYTPTLFTGTLYDAVEMMDPTKFTIFQNIYADKAALQIFYELFFLLYGIDFFQDWDKKVSSLSKKFDEIYLTLDPREKDKRKFSPESLKLLNDRLGRDVKPYSLIDQKRLEARNILQRSVMMIPVYLLSLVFKEQGYLVSDYSESEEQLNEDLDELKATIDAGTAGTAEEINKNINGILKEQTKVHKASTDRIYGDALYTMKDSMVANTYRVKDPPYQPVYFDPELVGLRGYFLFLRKGLGNFIPDNATFTEIINEVKKNAYIEFFERPDGQVSVRSMRYNERYTMEDGEEVIRNGQLQGEYVRASNLDIITRDYKDTLKGLVTKERFEYQVDLIGNQIPFQHYFYSNGKLLLQYGLLESTAAPNPNIGRIQRTDEAGKYNLESVYLYAKFVMELNNAKLRTGTITCSGDSSVQIGKTFFDDVYKKFGYINSVTKTLTVGGTYTTSFNLTYVRHAYETVFRELFFRELPEFIHIASLLGKQTFGDKSTPDSAEDKMKEERRKIEANITDFVYQPGSVEKIMKDIKVAAPTVWGWTKALLKQASSASIGPKSKYTW